MRTTINLDPDVESAVDDLRRAEGLGLSEAVNTLARRGLRGQRVDHAFTPMSYDLGLRIDVTDTAAALEILDEVDDTASAPR